MPQFQPDQVTFGDGPGYGAWDMGHAREHLQFVQSLAARTPPILLANYDFLAFLTAGEARRSQLQSHAAAHNLLHQALGITAVDLSAVNLDDHGDFDNWLGYHSSAHAQIRSALGIT